MKRIRFIAIALAGLAGTALILMAVVTFLLPLLLDKSALGAKMSQEVSALVEGDFTFDRLDIAVFPSPHAVVIKPRLTVPDEFTASVETIELYPDMLSTLTGHLNVDRVTVKRPEVTVWISASTAGEKTAHQRIDRSMIARSLLKTLSRLPIIDHGTVSQGRIALVHNRSATATFEDFDALVRNEADSYTIEATAASDLAGKITFKAGMHRRNAEASARLDIGGLDLGAVTTLLAPASPLQVEDGTADMGLSVDVHGDGNIVLDFNCSAPQIRLSGTGKKADLDGLKIAGRVRMDSSATAIAVSDFHLGNPAMQGAGSVIIADTGPRIRFDLEGRDIDIGSSRSVSLALAGTIPVVKTVFDILKDGTIPSLTVSGQADAAGGLAGLDNLVLHATLANGAVVIPGADLELVDVSGQVDMVKGILSGQNVAAHWQQSSLHQGKFEINLAKDPLPINVDTNTHIQAKDVVKILKKFITDKTFSEELARIDDLSGSATGNLALSGDTDRLDIAASAAALKLGIRHRSLPFELNISDGALSYENHQLHLTGLSGSFGTSSFAGLSGAVDLGAAKTFSIGSGTTRIVIKDMLPWLSSYAPISRITQYYGGGEGVLRLTEIQSGGPFADLSQVNFSLAGDLHDLTIKNLPAQPGPLAVASIGFTADPKRLAFTDGQVRMLDGSVNVSGNYPDYLSHPPKGISLCFDGRAGPRLIGWVTGIGKLPPWLKLQPLTFRKSQFTYAHREGHRISADLTLQDDLELNAKLRIDQGTIAVDSLKVQDQLSRALLSARKAGKFIDVAFEGTLHESTANKIAHLPILQSGSLGGKIKLSVNTDNPGDAKVLGELSGKKISVLALPEAPLLLEDISVKGMPEGIDITSAELSWNGAAAKVVGKIRPRAGAWPHFSLDVAADTIDADSMIKNFVDQKRKHHPATLPKSKFPALKGEASFTAKKLIVHGYSIQPIKVDVHFLDHSAEVTLKEAVLCDIPVEGTAVLEQQRFSYHAQPKIQSQDLGTTLECLFDKQFKADGTLDFNGSLKGHGSVRELVSSTTGRADMRLSNGRIYHDIILLNLLKFLNAVQVLTGQVTAENMMERGVGFDRFQAKATLQSGVLHYERFMLDGEDFKLGGSGQIDIVKKSLDLTLLVAPLKTSSIVFEHIPLIGGLLETLDTIPLRVKGPFDDLRFLPLAPSAVASEMQDIIKETFGIPMRLIHLDVFRKETNKAGH